jgi:hypothetical protein
MYTESARSTKPETDVLPLNAIDLIFFARSDGKLIETMRTGELRDGFVRVRFGGIMKDTWFKKSGAEPLEISAKSDEKCPTLT